MDKVPVQILPPLAAGNNGDNKFSDQKGQRMRQLQRLTDRQGTRHLSCPGGAEGGVLALLHYFHLSRTPHLLANQAE